MKMVVSDYDDTFYTNDFDVIKNVSKIEQFMKENIFVIATGRSYLDFKIVEDLYNIKYNYLVINHGATIINNGKIISNIYINNKIKNKLLIDLNLDKVINKDACSGINSMIELESDNLTKIHVRYKNIEYTKKIYNLIMNKYSNYINAFLVCKNQAIEIVSNNVNKSLSIKFIKDLEKIDSKKIYTIGDSYNDLQMIKDFNGFSIKNSIVDVKKYSKGEYNNVYELVDDVIKNKV